MHRRIATLDASASANQTLTNAVLCRVPDDERRHLLAAGVPIQLGRRQVLQEAGSPMAVVLFPVSCVVSIQTITEDGGTVEVAMVGREGVIGFPTGQDASPYTITVPVAGQALRFRPDVVRRAFDQSAAVRRVMFEHWHALLADVARGSACHCFHIGLQRFARWLLAASERAHVDALELTQEEFASILGLRRSAVTAIAKALRQTGAIRYRQGRVTILDRRRLSQSACECYRDPSTRDD